MRFKKIVAIVLAASFIAACGCNEQKSAFDVDEVGEAMEDITEAFIEALAANNEDAVNELVPDFDYVREMEAIYYRQDEMRDLGFEMISRAEIELDGDPEIHEDRGFAMVEVEVSYLSPSALADAIESDYPSYDEYLALLDSSDIRCETTKTLRFDYDEDEDEWYLTAASAHKISKLFTHGFNYLMNPANLTTLDALDQYETYLYDIAQYGSSDIENNYDISQWCRGYYDNFSETGEGPEVDAAFNDFVMAYMQYVLTHDNSISEYTGPYTFIIEGSAPSRDDLLEVLESDEFLTQYYMNYIRHDYLLMSEDDMWNAQTVLLYETLAEAVPDCSVEGYYFLCDVDPMTGSLTMANDMITYPDSGLYEAEHGVGWEQFERCYEAAIENLYSNGEMSRSIRNELLDGLTPENYNYGPNDDTVSPSGFENQAIGTYEQVPNWCTDGSIVYGYSSLDSNDFWMHYSKEPGWLDTVGYYIDEEAIRITCYYDCSFDAGTVLVYDWWIDGEQVVDSEEINIRQDGTTEIEVTLPVDALDGYATYEMRLWEEGHSHVIAYVTLTREA